MEFIIDKSGQQNSTIASSSPKAKRLKEIVELISENESINDDDSDQIEDSLDYDGKSSSLSPPVSPAEQVLQSTAMHNRYYLDPMEGKICFNCGQAGHLRSDCPSIAPCVYCGSRKHQQCYPNVCFNCFRVGHQKSDCPRPRYQKNPCKSCGLNGHADVCCQDIWRQYKWNSSNSTSSSSSPPPPSLEQDVDAFCYNCGESGHFGDSCRQRRPQTSQITSEYSFSAHATTEYLKEFGYHGNLLKKSFVDDEIQDTNNISTDFPRSFPNPYQHQFQQHPQQFMSANYQQAINQIPSILNTLNMLQYQQSPYQFQSLPPPIPPPPPYQQQFQPQQQQFYPGTGNHFQQQTPHMIQPQQFQFQIPYRPAFFVPVPDYRNLLSSSSSNTTIPQKPYQPQNGIKREKKRNIKSYDRSKYK